MSYRELRNFIEHMRCLGYPRPVSLESFRFPNFELVSHALFWLCFRYDPATELVYDIATEEKRINFLKESAQLMFAKASVKLSIKQLYRADGYAVKELLKISALLYDAVNATADDDPASSSTSSPRKEKSSARGESKDSLGEKGSSSLTLPSQTKLEELKEARTHASEIVDCGAKLFSLLSREEEIRFLRDRALNFLDSLSSQLESNSHSQQLSSAISAQITLVEESTIELNKLSTEKEKDQKILRTKVERKQIELERAETRLLKLKKARPAFLEDFERLENELKNLYEIHLEKFRNLQYLESELATVHEAEMEKKFDSDKALKRMQKKLREEELRILRGETAVDENAIDDSVFDSGRENAQEGEEDGQDDEDDDEDDIERRTKKRVGGGRAAVGRGRGAARGRAGGRAAAAAASRGRGGGVRGGKVSSTRKDLPESSDEESDASADGGDSPPRSSNKPAGGVQPKARPAAATAGGRDDFSGGAGKAKVSAAAKSGPRDDSASDKDEESDAASASGSDEEEEKKTGGGGVSSVGSSGGRVGVSSEKGVKEKGVSSTVGVGSSAMKRKEESESDLEEDEEDEEEPAGEKEQDDYF